MKYKVILKGTKPKAIPIPVVRDESQDKASAAAKVFVLLYFADTAAHSSFFRRCFLLFLVVYLQSRVKTMTMTVRLLSFSSF